VVGQGRGSGFPLPNHNILQYITMNRSYTTSVCFDVDGEWDNFEEIPYSEFIKAMENKLIELKREKYLDAFDLVDITEYDEQ
jgi:Ca2+-binding EF-hand superfamily protein